MGSKCPNETPHLMVSHRNTAQKMMAHINDPYEAASNSHALVVLTEWDEFKDYDYQRIYDAMLKPAFIFDGRNVLDHGKLREIGFTVYGIGIRIAEPDA